MISASSALCTLFALYFALSTLCDSHHRIRPDMMTSAKPAMYAYRDAAFSRIWRDIRGYAGGRTGAAPPSSRRPEEANDPLLRPL